MDPQLMAWAAAAALLVFWTLGAHNRLMALRNAIAAAFVSVDDALRRRAATLEPLLDALGKNEVANMLGPDALLAAQTQSQAAADALRLRPALAERAAALAQAEAALDLELAPRLAWLSRQINSDDTLTAQLAALHDASQRLVFARQLFNDAVRPHNAAVRQFPTRLIASLFGFAAAGCL